MSRPEETARFEESTSEAYFSWSAEMKLWGGWEGREGRTKDAAVGDFERPGGVE